MSDYDFLNMDYSCSVRVWIGKRVFNFENAEAAYQAFKSPDTAAKYVDLSAAEAISLSERIATREDWKDVRDAVMFNILCAKFMGNSDLTDKLLNMSADNLLGHTSSCYWEEANSFGQSRYQNMLCTVRSLLISDAKRMWSYIVRPVGSGR